MVAVACAQYDLFDNPNLAQRPGFPYLVVMQNDQLEHYNTRFVMPLARLAKVPLHQPRRLAQTIRIGAELLHPAAHLCAPLPRHILGLRIGSLKPQADVLRDALDAVISGV